IYYISSPTNTDIFVVKSPDDGATWTRIEPVVAGPIRRHMLDLDPYLYADRDTGRVFFADLYVACTEMSWSDDGGATWVTNPITCGRPVNDHETVFTGAPVTSTTEGYSKVVYYCFQDGATAGCSKSLDGGVVFTPPTAFAYSILSENCSTVHGHGVAGPGGTIYLPKADYCGRPTLAISDDEGASWRRVTVSSLRSAPDHEASVAVDAAGNLYYLWMAEDRLPRLVTSTDGGDTWSAPVMVAPPGVREANLPSIDVGAPGKIAMAYYGSSSSPGAPWIGSYAGTTWNAYMTITTQALSANPVFYSGSVSMTSDPMVRGRCGPGRCGLVFDFIDVIVAPDGEPWSSFVDVCTGACVAAGGNNAAAGIAGHLANGPSLL
ncbi:MAG: sialidase family protein, partial [Actinomycetota bacterium]